MRRRQSDDIRRLVIQDDVIIYDELRTVLLQFASKIRIGGYTKLEIPDLAELRCSNVHTQTA